MVATRGTPAESRLPFAALHELVRPLLDRRPVPSARAPARDTRRLRHVGDAAPTRAAGDCAGDPRAAGRHRRRAAGAGSSRRPAVGGPGQPRNRRFRRAPGESVPIVVVAATRRVPHGESEPGDPRHRLEIGALPAAAARSLLTGSFAELPPAVTERVLHYAAGNPLALLELPLTVHDDPPADQPLPLTPRLRQRVRDATDRARPGGPNGAAGRGAERRRLARRGAHRRRPAGRHRGVLHRAAGRGGRRPGDGGRCRAAVPASGDPLLGPALGPGSAHRGARGARRAHRGRRSASPGTGPQPPAGRRRWWPRRWTTPPHACCGAVPAAAAEARLRRAAELSEDGASRSRRLLRAAGIAFERGRPATVASLVREAFDIEIDAAGRASALWLKGAFEDAPTGDHADVPRFIRRRGPGAARRRYRSGRAPAGPARRSGATGAMPGPRCVIR